MSPSNRFFVEQEKALPGRPLGISLRTTRSERLSQLLACNPDNDESWTAYAQGSYLYVDQGQLFEQNFLIRIVQDDRRMITALQPVDTGEQTVWEMSGFGF